MPMNKDRKGSQGGHSGQSDYGRRPQRQWAPSHKSGRGGGNRK